MKQLFCLLFSFVLFTSCNGQGKTNLLIENATISTGQPKLIKTEGSGKFDKQYDILGCGLQDKAGNLWFGTSREGVYRYDGKLFTHFTVKDGLCSNAIISILEDKSGNIWFGSWVKGNEGICRYDGKSISQYKPYGGGWIRHILEDKNGDILCVTRLHGVCRFDGKTFTNFTEKGGIDNSSIDAILEDKEGNLWFGTEKGSGQLGEDGGLWRFDGKSFTTFTTKDGLVHNGVFFILEDRNGNIWVGTRNTGLCRYDPRRAVGKAFTSFSE